MKINYLAPFKHKHKSSISVRFKSYFRGCCQGVLPEVTSPEVTWPEAPLTGSDVTGRGHDRMWSRAQHVPAFCSYYSSSTKCTIAHDRHGYRMWRDPEGGSLGSVRACVTGSCAISALVGPFARKWCHQTRSRRASPGTRRPFPP